MVCVICLYICVLYECMCATLYHIHTVNLCWLHVLNRGHACHASGDLVGVTESQDAEVTECLYMTSQSHLLAKNFFITQMGSNYTKCRNLLVRLQVISIHQGEQAAIQRVTGQININYL